MALSNAERQRRYVERLKARAEEPHGPDGGISIYRTDTADEIVSKLIALISPGPEDRAEQIMKVIDVATMLPAAFKAQNAPLRRKRSGKGLGR
jgi:hypothetical protein